MQVRHRLRAVLGITQASVRIDLMEEIDPQVVQFKSGHVPAQVKVPADHISDVGDLVEGSAHGVANVIKIR